MINDSDLPHEHQANHFAAIVILPDEVLKVDMLEHRTAKWIRHTQWASLPTIQYRLENYLKNHLLISRRFAAEIAKHFAQEVPDRRWVSAVSLFFESVRFASIDQMTLIEVEEFNDGLCQNLFEPLMNETSPQFNQVFHLN